MTMIPALTTGNLKLCGDRKMPKITDPEKEMPFSFRWESPNTTWQQLWKSPCPHGVCIPE